MKQLLIIIFLLFLAFFDAVSQQLVETGERTLSDAELADLNKYKSVKIKQYFNLLNGLFNKDNSESTIQEIIQSIKEGYFDKDARVEILNDKNKVEKLSVETFLRRRIHEFNSNLKKGLTISLLESDAQNYVTRNPEQNRWEVNVFIVEEYKLIKANGEMVKNITPKLLRIHYRDVDVLKSGKRVFNTTIGKIEVLAIDPKNINNQTVDSKKD
ncbi:MAG TPA: hypothetical protein DCS93_19230 [Microscillaceae bacterium]|nr:hypothetical protein [Microscillaceae bacterium]